MACSTKVLPFCRSPSPPIPSVASYATCWMPSAGATPPAAAHHDGVLLRQGGQRVVIVRPHSSAHVGAAGIRLGVPQLSTYSWSPPLQLFLVIMPPDFKAVKS